PPSGSPRARSCPDLPAAGIGWGRDGAGVGQAGGAGGGQGAGGLGRTEPDRSPDGGGGQGDVLVVEDAAGDVAVDLERRVVEGAVALAGGGPAEGGQLGGQDGAAVRVAGCGRTDHAGWLGPGWPVGVEPGPQGGRGLGPGRL